MRPVRAHDVFTLTALGVAVLIPFVYYGIQIVGAAYASVFLRATGVHA